MPVTEQRYSFSFISGALYLRESVAVALLLRKHGDWDRVRREVLDRNALRQRTRESCVRLFREIRYRLQELTAGEVGFLCDAAAPDQRQLLFIAACLRYRFVREFVEEVLTAKAMASDQQVYPGDISRFFEAKEAEADEVARLKPSSRAKVEQVLLRMLVEAGLLDSVESRRVVRVVPSKTLARLVATRDPRLLKYLLLSNTDVRQLVS